MSKFKVGDRVKCTNMFVLNEVGTVIDVDAKFLLFDDGEPKLAVEFDNEVPYGHNYGGRGKAEHCLLLPINQFEKLECEECEECEESESIDADTLTNVDKLVTLAMEYVKLGKELGYPEWALLTAIKLAY